MTYSNSLAFTGDAQRVLVAASTILMTNGFVVVHQQGHEIQFVGPGLNSTRQNPLLGASKVTIQVDTGRLTVDADYGGLELLRRLMVRFPLLLGLGLGAFFALTMLSVIVGVCLYAWDIRGLPTVFWLSPFFGMLTPLLAVSPWFFLAPWLRQHLQRRTTNALDTLLINVCHAAQVA